MLARSMYAAPMVKKPRSGGNRNGADVYTLNRLVAGPSVLGRRSHSTSTPGKERRRMRVIPKERKVNCINGLCNGMSLRACSRVFPGRSRSPSC